MTTPFTAPLTEYSLSYGREVTEAEMDALGLVRDEFHGDWDYKLVPR